MEQILFDRLKERGILALNDVQEATIPPALEGKDIILSSPTGTGKTLAYLLPLVSLYILKTDIPARGPFPRILIIVPTVELAAQTRDEAETILSKREGKRKNALLIVAEANLARQIEAIRKGEPLIVIGTPARILQLIKMKKLKTTALNALVFDEVDRLVSDELWPLSAELRTLAPENAQTIALSATIPERKINRVKKLFIRKPEEIFLKDSKVLEKQIEHWAFYAEEREKIDLLRSFYHALKPERLLVFVPRASDIDNILRKLRYHGLPVAGLASSRGKGGRKEALSSFRSGKTKVLITTDLGARGLDIQGLDCIVQMGISEDPTVYTHRAGRAGRAGKTGIMASFGREDEMHTLLKIEKALKIRIQPREVYGGKILAPEIPEETTT